MRLFHDHRFPQIDAVVQEFFFYSFQPFRRAVIVFGDPGQDAYVLVPEFDLFSLPYLIRDTDHFKKVVSGPVGAKYGELIEKRGIKILAWFDNGYRNVFNNKRPIVTPDDLKGLKIRVMESPLMVNTVNAMGGSATPMSYSERYTALEQGVLDGGENAAGNVLNDKFYEVTGYFSMTQHFRPPGIVGISMKTWNQLNAEQQKVLMQEAKALQDYEIKLTGEVGAAAVEELKAKGMKINDAKVSAFRDRMGPVYADFTKKHGSAMLEQVQNTKKIYNRTGPGGAKAPPGTLDFLVRVSFESLTRGGFHVSSYGATFAFTS